MMPTHGRRNPPRVDALAGRMPAGGGRGSRGELCLVAGARLHNFAMWTWCVAAGARDCVWSHLGAAVARPFRMLQCPVAAGSPSYGNRAAVCMFLRV